VLYWTFPFLFPTYLFQLSIYLMEGVRVRGVVAEFQGKSSFLAWQWQTDSQSQLKLSIKKESGFGPFRASFLRSFPGRERERESWEALSPGSAVGEKLGFSFSSKTLPRLLSLSPSIKYQKDKEFRYFSLWCCDYIHMTSSTASVLPWTLETAFTFFFLLLPGCDCPTRSPSPESSSSSDDPNKLSTRYFPPLYFHSISISSNICIRHLELLGQDVPRLKSIRHLELPGQDVPRQHYWWHVDNFPE